MSIIKKSFIRSRGAANPDAPFGAPYIMFDRGGKAFACGIQRTQKHPGPNPMAAGYLIDLSTTGPLPEDVTDGFIKTTGAVIQDSNGLTATLNAGNALVEIDTPGIGPITPSAVLLGVTISGATPGNGNGAGFRLDNNQIVYTLDTQAHVSGGAWNAAYTANAGVWSIGAAGTIAVGNIADLDWVRLESASNFTLPTYQNYTSGIGTDGVGTPVDTLGGFFNPTQYSVSLPPTTFDLIFRAQWVSGSDMVVTFKYIAILPKLTFSTVD